MPILRGVAVAIVIATANVVPAVEAADHLVEISAFRFSALESPVMPGDRVTWINRDIVAHTASASDGGWDSGAIAPGAKVTLVLPDNFDRSYYCVYHPNMLGSL